MDDAVCVEKSYSRTELSYNRLHLFSIDSSFLHFGKESLAASELLDQVDAGTIVEDSV
jgi:hypothetical protein